MRNGATKIAARCKKAGLVVFLLWLALAAGWLPGTALAQPLVLQVEEANPSFDDRSNQPVVTFRLTKASARSYAEYTSKNVGRAMEIRVDGRVLVKTAIREPILGGSSQIAGNFTAAQVEDLAKRITAGGNKIEVEVVAD